MQTSPGPGRPRPLRLSTSESAVQFIDVETRRALALLRAANLSQDPEASKTLLRLAGHHDGSREAEVRLSSADIRRLAHALRRRGHPLTDTGLRSFKMDRGLSGVVRIGPEVASAYARMAQGKDTLVPLDPQLFDGLPRESQRALKLLAILARRPEELAPVAAALGYPGAGLSTHARELALALTQWSHDNKMPLTSEGLTKLAHAMGWAAAIIDEKLASFIAECVLARGEPLQDYTRVTNQGCTINRRTLAMLRAAEDRLGGVIVRVQKGSYEDDGGHGAHPHIGGGVVDISTRDFSYDQVEALVLALRQVGFAAWYRPRPDRPHVHAVAIGDREMSPSAAWQVKQYFAGRDGRSRMGRDPHGGPKSAPAWCQRHRLTDG